jgi:tRNA dimethylallyltransferase
MNSLVAIVGPTATGKSQLALHLARAVDGEIVSADSRQVYRYMDIGTDKPGQRELSLVSHHLIDIIDPDDEFSLAQYQQLAYQAIGGIQQRKKLPLLVGGSGLYLWVVLEGWEIPSVPPDLELRRNLEKKAAAGGVDELYRELVRVDPVAAQGIDRRNVRRVIRALEVTRYEESPFSQHEQKQSPTFKTLIIGLTTDRKELYRRIDLRVDQMIKGGLVEEVKRLLDMGYGFDLPAMSSIGYKQIDLFLRGELTLEAAVQQIKTETHRFVRRQYNWFRLKDKRIKWFDIQSGKMEDEAMELVAGFLSR